MRVRNGSLPVLDQDQYDHGCRSWRSAHPANDSARRATLLRVLWAKRLFIRRRLNAAFNNSRGDGVTSKTRNVVEARIPLPLHEGAPLILELGARRWTREATPITSLRHCRRIFNTRAFPALRSATIPTFSAAILGRSLLTLLVVSITGAEDDSFTRSIESEQSL